MYSFFYFYGPVVSEINYMCVCMYNILSAHCSVRRPCQNQP